VYCVWQVVKIPTFISNNPVHDIKQSAYVTKQAIMCTYVSSVLELCQSEY